MQFDEPLDGSVSKTSGSTNKRHVSADDVNMLRGSNPSSTPSMDGNRTFQVLGSQNDRAKMVILDEASDLRRYLGTIPAHEQHLPNRPDIVSTIIRKSPSWR